MSAEKQQLYKGRWTKQNEMMYTKGADKDLPLLNRMDAQAICRRRRSTYESDYNPERNLEEILW